MKERLLDRERSLASQATKKEIRATASQKIDPAEKQPDGELVPGNITV